MPVIGSGYIPGGGIGTELNHLIRAGYIDKMVVQIYNATPTLAAFIGNSQPAMGGVSSVSVNVQTASATNPQWAGFDASFNAPGYNPFSNLAEFNLKLNICPIPFFGMEAAVSLNHAIIPRIEAVMDDATNNTMRTFSTALFNNTTDTQAFIGLPGAIDDGTVLDSYGNISRAAVPQWKATVYNASSASPTRQLVLQYIAGTWKAASAKPKFGVMGPGTWTLLAQDFIGQETYMIAPGNSFARIEDGPESAFEALMVAGVPIFADPDSPEGVLYLPNTDYLALYLHEMLSFAFTGFESTLPSYQVGYIGCLLTAGELVCTSPIAQTQVQSIAYLSL